MCISDQLKAVDWSCA